MLRPPSGLTCAYSQLLLVGDETILVQVKPGKLHKFRIDELERRKPTVVVVIGPVELGRHDGRKLCPAKSVVKVCIQHFEGIDDPDPKLGAIDTLIPVFVE